MWWPQKANYLTRYWLDVLFGFSLVPSVPALPLTSGKAAATSAQDSGINRDQNRAARKESTIYLISW